MWVGYAEFGGNETINADRTETYCQRMPWFKPVYKNGNLAPMLGHGRYTTPLLDDAPWVDPDHPESLDFFGLYPLDITGVEDSTRSSTPIESLNDGGVPGALRSTTRTVVVSGVLVGATEAAVEYGMRWLRDALGTGPCADTTLGGTMCYLASAPEIDVSDEAAEVLAVLDGGYVITRGIATGLTYDGGNAATTLVTEVFDGGTAAATGSPIDAGTAELPGANYPILEWITNPVDVLDGGDADTLAVKEFDGGGVGATTPILREPSWPFLFSTSKQRDVYAPQCLTPYQRTLRRVVVNSGPNVTSKYGIRGGAAWAVSFTALAGIPHEVGAEVPVLSGFLDPRVPVPWAGGVEPAGAVLDLDGYIYTDDDCVQKVSTPIYDPTWPQVIPPPGPVSVPLGNYTPPVNWRRRLFTIPKEYVPSWGTVVPKLQVHAHRADLRTLRVRFYADPYKVGDISDDPCAYCGDFVVSYLPVDHTLVIDGSEERVYVIAPGGDIRRADSLVFATDGTPFTWPALSCGFGYVVTLDLPQTQAPPVVDLSLFARSAA